MIADKIAQAKKDKQKKLISLFVIVLGAALMAVLLLYLATNFKLISDEKANLSQQAQTTAPALDGKPELDVSSASLPINEASQNSDENRQNYIEAYQHYQSELKPALNGIDLLRWDKSISDQLQRLENAALKQFSAGSYAEALMNMNKLTGQAEATLARSQQEYNDAIASAKSAYADLDYNKAKLALGRATLHQKASEEIDSLSFQTENIPKIIELEQAIRIANSENEPAKELQAINALAKLEPSWGNYRERAAILSAQLAANKFNQAIARGYAALDDKQLNTARSELEKARAISSSRKEIGQLKEAIANINRTQQFETSVANAKRAEISDDWHGVSRHITQALIHKPNDKMLTDHLNKANQIIALKKQMTALLANPYRLANDTVKTRAKIDIIKAEAFANDTRSLSTLSAQLAQSISAVNKQVAVTVISDGNTSVSIRGVGIVGEVNSKTIQLKPGPYTFEGQRKGYQSKIVKVDIPLNKASFQLNVVADERI